MADYIKVEIEFLNNEQKEILIALLSAINYEGFEEEGDLLKAYIHSSQLDLRALNSIAADHDFSFSIQDVPNENWNQLWESHFEPVIINHRVENVPWIGVRADFHPRIRGVLHEIIITPKMSFGTGHHPTTAMMMKMMSEFDFANKTVLDFGTGTGILAILSEKLGAESVVAIDHDDHSVANATENLKLNGCQKVELQQASTAIGKGRYDIVLANIIKSVILENLVHFANQLNSSGIIVLSGLIKGDESEILSAAAKNRLILAKKITIEEWICICLTHNLYVSHTIN